MDEPNDKKNLEYLLSEYLDGQLTGRDKAKLERQLAEDTDLRAELRCYTALNEHLQAADAQELEQIDYNAQRAEIIAAVERKVLLEGPPRRRVRPAVSIFARIWPVGSRRRLMLRRVAAPLAVAAVLLIGVSVGVLLFRPAGPRAQIGEVAVSVLPDTLVAMGPAELTVKLKRLDADVWDQELPKPTAIPARIVMVSIGQRREISPSLFPVELFEIE